MKLRYQSLWLLVLASWHATLRYSNSSSYRTKLTIRNFNLFIKIKQCKIKDSLPCIKGRKFHIFIFAEIDFSFWKKTKQHLLMCSFILTSEQNHTFRTIVWGTKVRAMRHQRPFFTGLHKCRYHRGDFCDKVLAIGKSAHKRVIFLDTLWRKTCYINSNDILPIRVC